MLYVKILSFLCLIKNKNPQVYSTCKYLICITWDKCTWSKVTDVGFNISINQRYFSLLDSKASWQCDFYQTLIRHIPHLNVIFVIIFIIIIHHDWRPVDICQRLIYGSGDYFVIISKNWFRQRNTKEMHNMNPPVIIYMNLTSFRLFL